MKAQMAETNFADIEIKALAEHYKYSQKETLLSDLKGIQDFIDEADTPAERNRRKDLMMGFVYGSPKVELVKTIDAETLKEKIMLRANKK